MDSDTIVLKNIRRDIPALKPLAAKVISLQKQLIEVVKRYQVLNAESCKDEDTLRELLSEILLIDKLQREHLNLVREAEQNFSSQDNQEDSLFCTEILSNEDSPSKDEESSSPKAKGYRITGNEIMSKPEAGSSSEKRKFDGMLEESAVKVPPEDFGAYQEDPNMNWEDLTKEHWSETDQLLQKVERVGTRVHQRDFLSTMDLVHVHHFKNAMECLARRKLQTSQGKKVTTGPWQVYDVPTKVTNRRCNYLASGLHVTVRQKDPQRSITSAASNEGGMKTRHQDSRGSSRTSSRASSPVSAQADNFGSRDRLSIARANKLRTMTTRASKIKKVGNSSVGLPAAVPVQNSVTSSSASAASACAASPKATTDATESKTNGSLEPCVTYTVVDGVPHFKVFFPSSKDSMAAMSTTSSTKSNPQNSPFIKDSLKPPPVSIVESGIEIIRPISTSSGNSLHGKLNASSTSVDLNTNLTDRNSKLKMSSKNLKRPRLCQGYGSTNSTPKLATSVVETSITPINNNGQTGASLNGSSTSRRDDGKEEVGLCLEKCGSWMGAPHFKIYRTFPSLNSTSTSPVTDRTTVLSSSTSSTSSPSVTSTSKSAPKLSTSLPTPKLAAAPNKSAISNINLKSATPPTMPKLTMGNTALRNMQQSTMRPPPNIVNASSPSSTPAASPMQPKLVPIAPKLSPNLQGGSLSNFVLVPVAEKSISGVQANQQPKGALKRPISLLKTCPSLPKNAASTGGGGGQLLTVKNLKECLQNSMNYGKDVKVVVQKVPMSSAATAASSPIGPKLPAHVATEEVKHKMANHSKLLSPPALHHRHQPDKESKIEDSPSNMSSPTVIVADMSA